jgi:hypothetical protein
MTKMAKSDTPKGLTGSQILQIVGNVNKAITSVSTFLKECEKTEQVKIKAEASIRESDNEVRKAIVESVNIKNIITGKMDEFKSKYNSHEITVRSNLLEEKLQRLENMANIFLQFWKSIPREHITKDLIATINNELSKISAKMTDIEHSLNKISSSDKLIEFDENNNPIIKID